MSLLNVVTEPRAGLWYFAHPYTRLDARGMQIHAAMEANFRVCCLRAARLIEKGWLIYAPIAHTHSIKMAWPPFAAAATEDLWYDYDHRWIGSVPFAGLILAPGWKSSGGCAGEKIKFLQRNLPVLYFHDPGLILTGANT